MVLLTSNNTFGICDTSTEGHEIINNISGNGAFVMYVRTGDMIYTFLSKTSSATGTPVTTLTTTIDPDTTTRPATTTSTCIDDIKYYYNIFNVYNDETTLIYSCKNNSGHIFTSIDAARDNAYEYISEHDNGSYNYFKITVYWEKYDDEHNIIDSGEVGSFYTTGNNSTTSTDTTTSPASTMTTTDYSTETTTSPASTMTTTNHSTDTTTSPATTLTSTDTTTSPATTLTSTDTTTSPATTLTSTLDPMMVICDNCRHEYSKSGLNNVDGCPRCGHYYYTYK